MLRVIIIIFSILFFENSSFSQDEYFLTLRYEKVNLRQGPSQKYPVKIIYKKKFLPVLIQDQSDNFRKIRDHENNTGWIHISQLSKKKAAIVIDEKFYVTNWILRLLAVHHYELFFSIDSCINQNLYTHP